MMVKNVNRMAVLLLVIQPKSVDFGMSSQANFVSCHIKNVTCPGKILLARMDILLAPGNGVTLNFEPWLSTCYMYTHCSQGMAKHGKYTQYILKCNVDSIHTLKKILYIMTKMTLVMAMPNPL
jgi:hypothetical protein